MASRIKNLTMEQGADFKYTTKIYKDKASLQASFIDADNDIANSQIRISYHHVNAVATFGTFLNAVDEDVIIFLQAANTSAIPAGRYVYDLEYTDNNGELAPQVLGNGGKLKFRALEGIITVTPEATKE